MYPHSTQRCKQKRKKTNKLRRNRRKRKKRRQKEKENYNPQRQDYNLNQLNTKNWFGNKGGTNYEFNKYRNRQGGGNRLPAGLPPGMYNNDIHKDDNLFKGILKKNNKGQKLPSTRDGGVRAPVITIEHQGRTKDGQLCLKGSTKFTNCRFGDACRFIHLEEGELQKVNKGKKDLASFQKAYKETLSFSIKEEGKTAARGD